MKQIVAGHKIGQALCEALGLPKLTRSFELRCAIDKAVTVKCEYYPEIEPHSLQAALAEVVVVRREEPAPPTVQATGFDAWLNARNEEAHAAMVARHAALCRIDERSQAFAGLMQWAPDRFSNVKETVTSAAASIKASAGVAIANAKVVSAASVANVEAAGVAAIAHAQAKNKGDKIPLRPRHSAIS